MLEPGSAAILAGDYAWDGTLRVTNRSVSLIGVGATIKQLAANTPTISLEGATDTEVCGFTFVGYGDESLLADGKPNNVASVRIRHGKQIRIHDCTLRNHAGGGIRFDGTIRNLWIARNQITGMGAAITRAPSGADYAIGGVSGIGTVVHGLRIEDNVISAHGLGIGCDDGDDLIIARNTIYDMPVSHGIYANVRSNGIVQGNVIRRTGGDGIKISCTNPEDQERPLLVTGNLVEDVTNSGINIRQQPGAGDAERRNVQVSGNVVGNAQYGVFTLGQRGIVISDNRVGGTTSAAYLLQRSSGTFTSNVARECGGAGVWLTDPIGDWVLRGLDCIDVCLGETNGQRDEFNSCLCLATATPRSLVLDGVVLRYERFPKPETLQHGIRKTGDWGILSLGYANLTGAPDNVEWQR